MPATPTASPAKRPELWIYVLLLVVIFEEAIRARLLLPPLPFSDPDTWGYLFPGLSSLAGHDFVHTNGRSFPYPLFVYTLLANFGHFAAITVAQHTLGILSGAVLLWTWHRMRRFFPSTPAIRWAHGALGLAITTSFLLSQGTLLMEHSIRPEAIFPFFTILAPCFAVEYLIALPRHRNRAFFFGVALIFDSLLVYFLKPAWGLAAGFAILPVFVSFFRIRGAWAWKAAMVILPVALVGATLWYPEKRLAQEHDPKSARFLPQLLFCFNAHTIRAELVRDLEDDAKPRYDKELLARVLSIVDRELNANSRAYTSLGYDADNLMYRRKTPDGGRTDSVVSVLKETFDDDTDAFKAFCYHYYLRAWLRHPGAMAYKIANQFSLFYRLKDDPFDRKRATIETGFRAQRSLKALKPLEWEVPLYEHYLSETAKLTGSTEEWHQASKVTRINRILRPTLPISFGVALLIGAAFAVKAGRAGWRLPAGWQPLLAPLMLTLYAMSLNVGNCMTVAIVHTMEVSRYTKNQLIFVLLAEACAVLLTVAVVEALIRRGRSSGVPARPCEPVAGA